MANWLAALHKRRARRPQHTAGTPDAAAAQSSQLSSHTVQRLHAHPQMDATSPLSSNLQSNLQLDLQSNEVLAMQRMWGNRAVQRMLAPASSSDSARTPAAPMTVDADPAAEQRAQRVADQVVSGRPRVGAISPLRRATSDTRRAVDNSAISNNATAGKSGSVVERTVAQDIEAARGRGQNLHRDVRAEMEQRLGANFHDVRIHTDPQADRLNRALDATAFTTERDIFFRRGQYDPQSANGKHLLTHELTHVMQQQGGIQRRRAGEGIIQRAKGKSHIPFAGTARDNVFGSRTDRRAIPGDLTSAFVQEIDMVPLHIQTVEKHRFRKNKHRTLDGNFYRHKTIGYNGTTILVLSGSGGSSEQYTRQMAEKYCRTGAQVVAVNYRGYGGSTDSTPTEAGLYNDAMSIYQAVINGQGGLPTAINPADIVVHGYSLGGPIAATLVKRIVKSGGNVKGLVLDRAMTSTYQAARAEVNPLMALGAKMGVGSMSTKSKLKSIYKHAPNTPIVFSSAGTDSAQVTDTSMEATLDNGEESLQPDLDAIRQGNTRNVKSFVNKLKARHMVKDDLAANDRQLAQWAANKGMNVSEVRRNDLTHFSQNAMMDTLIPELGNRGLLNDGGNNAYQNPSKLKRTTVQSLLSEVASIDKLVKLPERFAALATQLGQTTSIASLDQVNHQLKDLIDFALPVIQRAVDKLAQKDQSEVNSGLQAAQVLYGLVLHTMLQQYILLAEQVTGVAVDDHVSSEEFIEAIKDARRSSNPLERKAAINMIANLQYTKSGIMS